MNAREERGLIIAATCRLNRLSNGTWLVPSQTRGGDIAAYQVNLEAKTCTCPDHVEGGFTCKHYFAASIVHKRDILPDGTIVETKTMTITEKKVYKQDWPKYNAAQATEKRRFRVLLHELCRRLPLRDRAGNTSGQNPHLPSDAVFTMAYKVYCGLSARRFSTDLLEAHEMGFVSKPIPGMKATTFAEDAYYTPILRELVGYSARPLRALERDFAIDSSGFGSTKYEKWYDHKYGITRNRCVWVKTHIASGVKTNVVTAVRILDKDAADAPQFVPLLKETRKHFTIGEVSADKAYASLENFEAVAECGGEAFIAFKNNTTGAIGGQFEKAFHYFKFNQDEYMAHYHKRSNVESTFSAIKRKFGADVVSKAPTAMVNEVLCKIICHNLTCLIQEQESLGIVPVFWKDEQECRKAFEPVVGSVC
ncbi:transposase [Zavarzinella formosa]|uniref:transposase n=1 Tax=Zavarzinella formosa TaxID=360055 RepID=UPI0002E8EE10|nr:transposase [Zavarzinella formosa]